MKIMITGGGTGGHVYPALSIAEALIKDNKEHEILFVGTQKGLEGDVIPKTNFDFKAIEVQGFRRKLSLDTLKSFGKMFKGFFQAGKIIKDFKPDIIVGTGGYVAGPVMLQGALKGIHTLIHEQNAIPGITVKILAPFVDKICVSYEESFDYFKNKNKLLLTGNPIRDRFSELDPKLCKNNLKITKPFLLSVGGSGGAQAINDVMVEVIKAYNGGEIQIAHVTGRSYYDKFLKSLEDNQISLSDNIHVFDYLYNMPEYMVAADMILSRSGALTLAEIAMAGIPSILLPSPYVAHDHQAHNARVYEKNGAGLVVLNHEIKPGLILKLIEQHIFEPVHLEKMKNNAKKLSKPDATDLIVKEINRFN